MARITVEDCLDKTPNRFALVMLVAKRAKALLRGATATVGVKNNKQVVMALREVAMGNVIFRHDDSHGTPNEQIQKDLDR